MTVIPTPGMLPSREVAAIPAPLAVVTEEPLLLSGGQGEVPCCEEQQFLRLHCCVVPVV